MLTSSLIDLLPGQPAAAFPGAPSPSGDGAIAPDFALTLGGLLAGSSPAALAMPVAGERQLPAGGGKDVPVLATVEPPIEGGMSLTPADVTLRMPHAVARDGLHPPPVPLGAPEQGDDPPIAPVKAKADKAAAPASPAAAPDRDDPDPPLVPELAWLLPPPPVTAPPPGPAFVVRLPPPQTDAAIADTVSTPPGGRPDIADPPTVATDASRSAPTEPDPTIPPDAATARAPRGRERRSPEAAAARLTFAQAASADDPQAPTAPVAMAPRPGTAGLLGPGVGSQPDRLPRALDRTAAALADRGQGSSPISAPGTARLLPEAAPASADALPSLTHGSGSGSTIAASRPNLSPALASPARPAIDSAPAIRGASIAAAPITLPAGLPLARSAKAAGPLAAARLDGGAPTDPALNFLGASTAPNPNAPLAVTGASHVQHPGIDLTREPGLHRMIDRIEQLRDAADARDTRIRLVPDSLGPVEIAVRREGEAVRVHFTAAEASTRQLIADAQPRLTELAEARGVRIERATIDAGSGGDAQARPQPQPQPAPPRAPARAATAAVASDSTDERIA